MRHTATLAIVLLAILTAGAALYTFRKSSTTQTVPQRIVEAFSRWQQKYQRLYASPAEQGYRLNVFHDQTLFIETKNQLYEENARKAGVVLTGPAHEMNMFGDLSNEEFIASHTGLATIKQEYLQQDTLLEADGVEDSSINPVQPPSLGQDWVPKIRHQGTCASCWAFAAIPEMERKVFAKYKQYIDLSQQELVDCVRESGGCRGGHSAFAFNYMRTNGISKASDYPYIANQGQCWASSLQRIRVEGFGVSQMQLFTTRKAQTASSQRIQASLGVKADGAFRYVSRNNDVYDASYSGECGMPTNHAIVQWGYGAGVITVYNSYGKEWGYNGFKQIKICGEGNVWGAQCIYGYPYSSF